MSTNASATAVVLYEDIESSVYQENLQQEWAFFPQSEPRIFSSNPPISLQRGVLKWNSLFSANCLERQAVILQQKGNTQFEIYPRMLGLTNIQRIFPFHQFW